MSDEAGAEVAYLRRSLDEIGAENLVLSHRTVLLRTELEVRRRGFSLLARLGRSLGAHTEIEPAIGAVLPIVESELQVQRTVALRLEGEEWAVFAWTGYDTAAASALSALRLQLPDAPAAVVTGTDDREDWIAQACDALGVQAFVAAALPGGTHALLAGRLAERGGFFPRFERADLDTLNAVGELIKSTVENTLLAALSEARRFLPPVLVAELLKGRLGADEGHERREITLLAVDMVGSTPLAERLAPDTLADLLNAYLREMTTLAHAHGGTVGSIAGDGMLLIFGAPESTTPEEQAWSAAQAAFAMLARAEVVAEETGEDVRIRIGLNTGVASVGVYGSDTQRTYTALGLPVHLAARLEGAAGPGEVLASARTVALLGERVDARERERLTLKGIADPVVAYVVEPR